ncbi:MAG: GNAT family N-acetyltransferase [Cellulomonadaceae bacterium]
MPRSLPLRTERLVLRVHEPADTEPLGAIYGRADVARFLIDPPWTPRDADRHAAERLSRTDLFGPSGALALVIEHRRVVIGDVALWLTNREHRVAEVGWVLDPAHGGRGYGTEAAAAVLDLAFTTYRLHRVVAQLDARNAASARLAERLGMRREAHLRQDWWSKGEWTDTLVYGLLDTDDRPAPTRCQPHACAESS